MTALECALHVLALNLLPLILPTGQKKPRQSAWHKNRYTPETIKQQFSAGEKAVGLILGPKSAIDIECDSPESPADLSELFDGAIPETPSWSSRRGIHRLFAWDDRLAGLGATTKYKSVEIRLGADGKAAYSLLPPSVTDGCAREWIKPLGSVAIASLPDAVVAKILAAAKEQTKPAESKNPKRSVPVPPSTYTVVTANGDRPGDDYCQRADWQDILEPHGWQFVQRDKGTSHWRRPGKMDEGTSATTGYCTSDAGHDLLFVFSSEAAPLVQNKGYTKFAAYTHLNHAGDFVSASRALASQGYGKQEKRTVSSELIALASDFELFHSTEREPFATVQSKGHFETYAVNSKDFELYLDHEYYKKTGKSASQKALSEAIRTIAAVARFEGSQIPVHLRVAQIADAIYLDLGSDTREVVHVTAQGWNVVSCPGDVKFRRPKGMQALPAPVTGGTIDELRQFVNVDDGSWYLLVACIVAALRPTGPYPIALLTSNHGSGKTTTMRVCRSLVDPNTADVRAPSHDVMSLMVGAKHSAMLCIDNCDKLPQWLSSALCRLSTGGGMASRALYTNDEEHIVNCMRPTWITCITDVAEREDLLSRCVLIKCPPVPATKRRDEHSLNLEFTKARPRILGALLNGVCSALGTVNTIQVDSCPRLADFYKWIVAAEKGLGWAPGTFKTHFENSQQEVSTMALDHPVVATIQALLLRKNERYADIVITDTGITWEGTATELLFALNNIGGAAFRDDRNAPRSASTLSAQLKRLQVNLADIGIQVSQHRKIWTLTHDTQVPRDIEPLTKVAA